MTMTAAAQTDDRISPFFKGAPTETRFEWTEERVNLARKLWRAGKSALDIAKELGAGVTRNAVIGKLHWLGLKREEKPVSKSTPASTVTTKAPPRPEPVAERVAPQPAPKIVEPPPPEPEIDNEPSPEGLTFFDLRDKHCRWPLSGEGLGIVYCGCRRVPDATVWYCEQHLAQAGQTPRTAKQREGDEARRKQAIIRARAARREGVAA